MRGPNERSTRVRTALFVLACLLLVLTPTATGEDIIAWLGEGVQRCQENPPHHCVAYNIDCTELLKNELCAEAGAEAWWNPGGGCPVPPQGSSCYAMWGWIRGSIDVHVPPIQGLVKETIHAEPANCLFGGVFADNGRTAPMLAPMYMNAPDGSLCMVSSATVDYSPRPTAKTQASANCNNDDGHP